MHTFKALIDKKDSVRASSYHCIFGANHQRICSGTYLQLYSSATVLSVEKTPACLKKIALHFKPGNLSYVPSDLWIAKSYRSEKQIVGYISHRRFIWYITQHGAWFDLLCTQAKETENENSVFPFLVFPAIFCHPSEGKVRHEVTVVLHSITDGRIKPSCLGGWFIAAQVELNVSFLNSYPIWRGFWLFLSCRGDQGAARGQWALPVHWPLLQFRHQGPAAIHLGV